MAQRYRIARDGAAYAHKRGKWVFADQYEAEMEAAEKTFKALRAMILKLQEGVPLTEREQNALARMREADLDT